MYNINDFVVYKKDVCKIKNITTKNNTEYYVMEPIDDNSLKIQIPINADNIFLRNLKTKNEIESLIKNIPNISIIENGDKMIENEYKKLLDTGTFEDLIKIIKTTYLRNKERMDNKKKMSDKDSIYFEKRGFRRFSQNAGNCRD